jgi:hypothetical protein
MFKVTSNDSTLPDQQHHRQMHLQQDKQSCTPACRFHCFKLRVARSSLISTSPTPWKSNKGAGHAHACYRSTAARLMHATSTPCISAVSSHRSRRQKAAGDLASSIPSIQQQEQQQSSVLSTALEPRGWSLQAAAVTDNLGCDASRFKSLAVYAEVKLAEALDKAAKASAEAVDADGEPLPNSLKTAVCCQVGSSSACRTRTLSLGCI